MSIKIDSEQLLTLLGNNGERWVQGKWGNGTAMCLHGAIRRCQPQPGDAYLIEQVARLRGWGTDWNDDENTDWTQVRDLIVSGIEVTDVDLAETFGPQWEQIVALVRRAAVVTTEEINRLAAAQDAAQHAAWAAAQDAAQDAARALAVRDLIGQNGFTQQHYDLLTQQWRNVIGRVHPDDAA